MQLMRRVPEIARVAKHHLVQDTVDVFFFFTSFSFAQTVNLLICQAVFFSSVYVRWALHLCLQSSQFFPYGQLGCGLQHPSLICPSRYCSDAEYCSSVAPIQGFPLGRRQCPALTAIWEESSHLQRRNWAWRRRSVKSSPCKCSVVGLKISYQQFWKIKNLLFANHVWSSKKIARLLFF